MNTTLLFRKRLPFLFWSLAMLVMLMPGKGFGQITEGFETGLPGSYNATLSSYTLGSGSWQLKDVIAGTTGVQAGTKSAQIRSATAAQIITPTLVGGVGAISFYVTGSSASGAYQVNISTDDGATWSPATGSPFTIGTTKALRSITVNNASVNKIQIYRTGATIYIDNFAATINTPTCTAQTITALTTPVAKTFGDASYSVATTATSGLAVTYGSNNTGVATVDSSGTVIIVGAGTATITASQAGNGTYCVATSVTQALTVNKATPTISVAPSASEITSGQTLASSVLTGGTASVDGTFAFTTPSTVTSTGTATYEVTFTPTDATNYTTATTTVSVTINPSSLTDQVLTFPALSSVTYGTVSVSLLATSDNPGGNSITYSSSDTNVATISGSSAVIVGAGTTTITASQAGSGTHNAAVSVTQELTVDKATPTISVAPTASTIIYGQTLASSSLTDGTASVAGTFTFTTPSTAPNGGNANQGVTFTPTDAVNYTTTTGVASVTVNKADQSISNFTATDSREFGAAAYALGATATNGGSITYTTTNNTTVASVSGNTVTIIGLGTSVITATQAGDSNYNPISANQTLTVTYPVLAGWDVTGLSGTATATATTFNANLVSTSGANTITRGAGAAASTAGNSFRTAGFLNNGIATTNTDYFQTTLTATAGNVLNLATISANLAGTTSFAASPGVSSQFAYSLDGTSFTLIGSPIVTIASPASLSVDLTGITALQNVAAGTTVTFRYYASGQTTTGGWGFQSAATAGTNGLAFSGFFTSPPPTVTTNAATVTSSTSATFNGTVNANGTATTASFGNGFGSVTATTPVSGAVTGSSATATSVSVTGLSVNTQYTYKAIASGGLGGTVNGSDISFYTLANMPSAPTLSSATESSIVVAIGSGDGNPSTTLYALQLNNATYVQVGGASLGAAVWQTAADWATTTVADLACGASQSITVYAKNGDGVLSDGTSASLSTTACVNPSLQADPLAAFNGVCLNESLTKSFGLLGINLVGTVTVEALTDFTFSTDNSTFSPSLTLTPVDGELLETISVKFTPTLAQSYSATPISITGGGTAGITVAVSASGINTPVSGVTAGATSGITTLSSTFGATTYTQGCSSVLESGIQYSTDTSFSNAAATNAAAATINGLAPNTVYNYRAYATDATGTVTGSASTFITAGLSATTASAANSIGATSFTANWDAMNGASGYRLDVSTSPTFTSVGLASDLFISEYGEGSGGSKKYIEIFNGTGADVDLANYQLWGINNGGSWPESTLDLTGTLANNDTYVVANNSTDVLGADLYVSFAISPALSFSGDDAIGLAYNGGSGTIFTLLDAVGTDGVDPGSGFAVAGTNNATVDKILIRKESVGTPNTNWTTSAGTDETDSEWNVSSFTYNATNQTTNLGSHTFSSVGPSYLPGYENLSVNGTSQVVSGLTPLTPYYYRVRAESANSTSANSNVITVTTTAAPPTFASVAQAAQVVCDGTSATFNLEGLLSGSTSTIYYTIDGGVEQSVTGVVANGSGSASFNLVLPYSANGLVLAVTSVERTDVLPTITLTITENNTTPLSVTQNSTYYADADGDGFGNPSVTVASCQAVFGYVTNNLDTNDALLTYVDADGDGFGSTTFAVSGVTNATDCNDAIASLATLDTASNNVTMTQYSNNAPGGAINYTLVGFDAVVSLNALSGLPQGVSDFTIFDGGTNGNLSIGGTPEVSGTFNYALVAQLNGCSQFTIQGTITVLPATFYLDADGDGYGNPNVSLQSPSGIPVGYVLDNTDCDDTKASVYPDAVEVCYDGLDNDCDGIVDNGCVPLVSTVQTAQCGQTLAKIDDYVYANLVSGAQGYRFKVTNMVTNQVQTIDRFLRVFRITQLPNYAFNTEYQVEVAVRKFNVWQPTFGAPCTVKTPATTTQLVNCGASLTAMTDVIYANLVPFATGYRFRVTNILNPLDTQVINRSLREFRMSLLTDMQYSTTYNVEVAVRDTDGVTYLPYGPICEVTTPIFPASYLQDSQCDDYEVPSTNTILYAQSFTGAEGYRFRLQNLGEGYTQEVDRNLRTVRLSDFTGLAPGATYTVKVALKINGVWGSFTGKSCSIITPGGARAIETEAIVVKGNFAAVAYPNPFASTFAIKVQTLSQEVVQLKVYDMVGRLVDQRETTANDKEATMFGERYPSGVYNVVVTQGNVTETLRVVKR